MMHINDYNGMDHKRIGKIWDASLKKKKCIIKKKEKSTLGVVSTVSWEGWGGN